MYEQAWKHRAAKQSTEALKIAQEGLTKAQEVNDLLGQALMLKIQAQLHHDRNELAEALKIYKQIEPLYIQLDMLPEQMHTLRHIGGLFLELGKAECAERCLVQVAEQYDSDETTPLEKANAYRIYALSLEERGKPEEANKYWRQARNLYAELGLADGVKEADQHL